jgi:DNA-binding response OmpR family regulator
MTNEKWRILVVEDDIELAELIQDYLNNYEFQVELIHNGAIAVEQIIQQQPDLVILDLMLPGKDGISICKEVRDRFENSIVMLTASNESVDHVLGLEIGADEFIRKPVEPRILLAHLRALLRRQEKTNKVQKIEKHQVGQIELFENDRLVKVAGQKIELLQNEYELLHFMFTHIGQIITRDQIFRQLKGIDYDGVSRFSDILVSQVRNKLAVDGISGNHIKTVRNKGYLLVEQF